MNDKELMEKINLQKAKRVQRRADSKCCTREDYGVKGMKWGDHKAKEEESSGGSSKAAIPKTTAERIKAIDDAKMESIGKNSRGEKQYRMSVPGVCEVVAWTDKRNKNEHTYQFNTHDGTFEGNTPVSGSLDDLQNKIKERVKKVISGKAEKPEPNPYGPKTETIHLKGSEWKRQPGSGVIDKSNRMLRNTNESKKSSLWNSRT